MLDRLDEKIIGAEFEDFFDLLHIGDRGDDEDLDTLVARIGAQHRQDLDPVHDRHTQIERQEIGPVDRELEARAEAVISDVHQITAGGIEHVLKSARHGLVVIDDEHALGWLGYG